jgi:hypothetical protein
MLGLLLNAEPAPATIVGVGGTFTVSLLDPGVEALGARVEVPDTRAIVSAYRMATLDAGVWVVTLDGPVSAGEYLLVWRTPDPEPPAYELFLPLTAEAAIVAGIDVADPASYTPTVQDVADALPSFTRGGFDDDRESAGAEQGTFTDDTSPTAAHVSRLIVAAVREVRGRAGVPIPDREATIELAKQAVVWHVAATVTAPKTPAAADEASGMYRGMIGNYTSCIAELQTQSRRGPSRLA